jgi:hypothetical protein
MKKTFSMVFIVVAMLAGIAQPVVAAANYDLNIHNNTEESVKVTLTGPKNYSFTLDPGKWTKTVAEGTYKYSYGVCAEKFTGEIKITDDMQWLIIDPCSALPEYTKFVVDSHLGQQLTLTLTGPETYALAIELGSNKFLSIQTGFYNYSYDACGSTLSGSVRVLKNGTGNLILYACEQLGNHPPEVIDGVSNSIFASSSNLRIGSHYAFPIRVTLIGPTSYSFVLTTGLNRLNVQQGTYDYFYSAYGVYRSGTFTVGEAGVTMILSPVK